MQKLSFVFAFAALLSVTTFHSVKATAEEAASPQAQEPTDKPVEVKMEKPVENPTDATAAAPSPAPIATPAPVTEKPAEKVAEKPEEKPAEKAPEKESEKYTYGKTWRPLGQFLVGPYGTIAALPRPISYGIESKFRDMFGLSLGYGYFPKVTLSSVSLKITGWDVRLKWYPFQGAFFLGAGLGNQTLEGSSTQTVSGIPATLNITQDNAFFLPHLGWNWIWSSGFFMGMDLGVQLSMSRTTKLTSNITDPTLIASADYQKLQKDVQDKGDQVGKIPLPLLTLLKFGFFF